MESIKCWQYIKDNLFEKRDAPRYHGKMLMLMIRLHLEQINQCWLLRVTTRQESKLEVLMMKWITEAKLVETLAKIDNHSQKQNVK